MHPGQESVKKAAGGQGRRIHLSSSGATAAETAAATLHMHLQHATSTSAGLNSIGGHEIFKMLTQVHTDVSIHLICCAL